MNGIRLPLKLFGIAQTAGVYPDSKTLVDRPLKVHPNELQKKWTEFESSWNGNKEALLHFIEAITDHPGVDLIPMDPPDWEEKTEDWLKDTVQDEGLRNWLYFLNKQWKTLCRKTNIKKDQEDRHTLIPSSSFYFIPGDRFREVYYWDSHWTVLGLLVSEMFESATSQVETLLELLERYGHVPNGSRGYYLNRSQPPILSMTLRTLIEEVQSNDKATARHKCKVLELVRRSIPLLIREHAFWTAEPHLVQVQDRFGETHDLSRYCAETHTPRPEAYKEDLHTYVTSLKGSPSPSELYCDIASAAESGWDFSSRWLADSQDPRTIQTTRIIPVDLNALLFALEVNIAHFASLLQDSSEANLVERYTQKACNRRRAFDVLFWDSTLSQWRDVHMSESTTRKGSVFVREGYLSNYVPLYCGIEPPTAADGKSLVARLKSSKLLRRGGFVASVYNTGEQWDGLNVWPPLQSILVEGLMSLSRSHPSTGADTLATEAASRFLYNMYLGFQTQSCMFEKYHGEDLGRTGSGGEYSPQIGFGWTNGVALWLLKLRFGQKLNSYIKPE